MPVEYFEPLFKIFNIKDYESTDTELNVVPSSKIQLTTFLSVLSLKNSFPHFMIEFFDKLIIKHFNVKIKSKQNSPLIFCLRFESSIEPLKLSNGLKLEAIELRFSFLKISFFIEVMYHLKKTKVVTLKDFFAKKFHPTNKAIMNLDFLLSNDILKIKCQSHLMDKSDGFSASNIDKFQIYSFNDLFSFGEEKQFKKSKIFRLFRKKNNQNEIFVQKFEFNVTEKSLNDFLIHIECNITFQIYETEMILKRITFERNIWNFECKLIENEFSTYSSIIISGNQSKNSISYKNCNFENCLFKENVEEIISHLPDVYKNYSCCLLSKSTFDVFFDEFETSFLTISIDLTKFVRLNLNETSGYKFYFGDSICEFSFDNKRKVYKYSKKNNYLSPLNSIKFDRFIGYFELKQFPKELKEKDFIVENISFKFDGFLELSSKEILIRIPLHERENIEIFIQSTYNSILDENFKEKIYLRGFNKFQNISFKF